MSNAIYRISKPENEKVLSYSPGTPEREQLKKSLSQLRTEQIEIPLVIGGKEVRTGNTGKCLVPHEHKHVLATYHKAGPKEVALAVDAAMKARKEWAMMPWQDRLAIFLKAADLLAGPYRMLLNAATMVGQSKNPFQAEIDSACELVDFFRFNSYFASQIYSDQPESGPQQWNQMEYRPLDGFVFAVSPFNFTSIAGNLATAPALLGNTVLWKPASTAIYSGYYLMQLYKAAGIPDGVINYIPGSGAQVGDAAVENPHFAGIHFTGSTSVFQGIWKKIGENISNYHSYPRIVGETGGKDFIFVHNSADVDATVVALVRGAFEYQGQKCSAASRAYVPKSLWPSISKKLKEMIADVKMGPPEDFSNFFNAVIDKAQFNSVREYIECARNSADAEIFIGGEADDSVGFFIRPTVILAKKPDFRTMVEEIFGPVLTIFVYDDSELDKALELCDKSSPYALTGAVFAQDRYAIIRIKDALTAAAGNFYINDKPTGAVVGQQPFGGGRASGTNDKAGSIINLYRWLNARAVKENFVPAKDYKYPFMS